MSDIKELLALLRKEKQEPRTFQEQKKLQAVLDDVKRPDASELEIDFYGFLKLMRWFNDSDTERMLQREQNAAREANFGRVEVDYFRELFTSFDTNAGGTLGHQEVRDILRSVGLSLPQSMQESLREKSRKITGNVMGNVQFDQFLLLLRQLKDENFADIADKLDKIIEERRRQQL